MTNLSELFYSHLVVIGAGLIVAVGGLAYRSKCSEVHLFWNCCWYKRDITSEIQNDEHITMPSTALPQEELMVDMEAPPHEPRQRTESYELNEISERWKASLK